jgi:anaerobic ribonucleoside-triphosphate reductase
MDQLTLSLREKTLEQKVEILEIIEWAFSNMEESVIVTIMEISKEQTIDYVDSIYMDQETEELVIETEEEEEYRFNPGNIIYIDIDATF